MSRDLECNTTVGELRPITKLARKYAQNRSLPRLVMSLVSMLFFIPWLSSIYLLKYGDATGFWLGVTLFALTFAGVLYLKYSGTLYSLSDHVARRLYGEEGQAGPSLAEALTGYWPKRIEWISGLAIVGFIFFVKTNGITIPEPYFQPVTALLAIPLWVMSTLAYRSRFGLLPLLWPLFYAVHAVAVLLGAPILFSGPLANAFNVAVPVVIYLLLTLLIAHLYSRSALKKLRLATRSSENDGPSTTAVPG